MSMEIYVFCKKEKIPTTLELQKAIKDFGFDYTLSKQFNITNSDFNFYMGDFEGLESGFDYILEPYLVENWDFEGDYQDVLKEYDSVAVFGTFSNAQEIVAMVITASILCHLSDGIMLSDFFFDGEFVKSKEAIENAKYIVENSREQFDGPSTTRKAVLDNQEDNLLVLQKDFNDVFTQRS